MVGVGTKEDNSENGKEELKLSSTCCMMFIKIQTLSMDPAYGMSKQKMTNYTVEYCGHNLI